ncbi:unnamed protein product, partial [Adineta ricciae]
MSSWFITLNILLLLSSTVLQARLRINSKRRYPMSTKPFVPPPYPFDDNSYHASEDDDSLTESYSTTMSTTTARAKNRASDEQVQQFTRLIFERLNLKEPPNVTMHVHDGTGIPPPIVKQLEEHPKHHDDEEDHVSSQQKYHDDIQPTTERAILPGEFIQSHTCQRQLSVKFNLNKETANSIDCFRFAKSPMESKGLPTNQIITQLRIYVKKNYFQNNPQLEDKLTGDMFQIYQVFRPTSNETLANPFQSLTGTIRLAISEVKELNDKWLELTIDPHNGQISIQQIYKQFIMPWYGLAMNRELQTPSSSQAWASYYRRYYAKKSFDSFLRSNPDEDYGKDSSKQLPYMLVEYGEKIAPAPGNRATRGVKKVRPPQTCDPKSPCCRRPLTIDLDQGNNALNFVIYPRKIDIGECVGLCGTSGSSLKFTDVKNAQVKNEQNAAHNLLLLHHNGYYHKNTTSHENKSDQQSSNCCSYSRTGGLELMYSTTNGGPILRKFIP